MPAKEKQQEVRKEEPMKNPIIVMCGIYVNFIQVLFPPENSIEYLS
jgi:hypothetical protein